MSADVTVAAAPASTGSSAPPATLLSAAPAPQALNGGDSASWKARLPDRYKTTPSLAPFLNFESETEAWDAIGKNYDETKSWVGKKLQAPNAESTPEQVAEWRKIVGAPEAAEGYGKTLRPEAFPEEQWNSELEGKFREIGLKHHLTPEAAKDIAALHAEFTKAGLEAYQQSEGEHIKTQLEALKTEWGKDFDSNLNLSKRILLTGGIDPSKPIDPNSAEFVKGMAKIAKLITESSLINGAATGTGGSIETQIADIHNPSSNSLLARKYHGHLGPQARQEAQAYLHRLYEEKAKLP